MVLLSRVPVISVDAIVVSTLVSTIDSISSLVVLSSALSVVTSEEVIPS